MMATKASNLPTEQRIVYWSIDEILDHVGEYGRFQKLLNILLCVMCIPVSYPIVIMYFSSFEPSWRCVHNSSVCNYTGVFESADRRKCDMSRTDWEYTKSKSYSFVTQFDITCNEQWKVALTRSVSFLGWGVGAVILGWLGDKYGRRTLLLPSILATIFVTLVTPFLPNIYLVICFRFFACFFIPGSTLSSFILITEVVGVKRRSLAGLLIYAMVPMSFCIIVAKAYLIEEWKMLGIACSVPYLLVLIFYSFIPESIHWLCAQGRTNDVMDIVGRIARWNKKELPPYVRMAPPVLDLLEHTTSLLDIFRTRALAICSLFSGYLWLVVGLGYFGLLVASNDLGGSVYWDFFIMSFTDVISSFVAVYVCERIGERKGTLLSMFFAGILCLAVAPIPMKGNMLILRITCGMIGKFMISITFNTIYMWTVKLYPTRIRAKGMGWLQVNTRIGSTLAPWISEWTAPLGKGAPFITMGIPVVFGALIGLKLPDTQVVEHNDDSDENTTVINNAAV